MQTVNEPYATEKNNGNTFIGDNGILRESNAYVLRITAKALQHNK